MWPGSCADRRRATPLPLTTPDSQLADRPRASAGHGPRTRPGIFPAVPLTHTHLPGERGSGQTRGRQSPSSASSARAKLVMLALPHRATAARQWRGITPPSGRAPSLPASIDSAIVSATSRRESRSGQPPHPPEPEAALRVLEGLLDPTPLPVPGGGVSGVVEAARQC